MGNHDEIHYNHGKLVKIYHVLQICMTWIKRQKRILSLGVGLKKVWLEGWNIKEEAPFELCDGEELPRSFTVNAVRFVES